METVICGVAISENTECTAEFKYPKEEVNFKNHLLFAHSLTPEQWKEYRKQLRDEE